MNKLIYYLLKGLVYALSLLPFCLLYALADVVFVLLYHIFRYRRKVVRNNLVTSFPDMSGKEVKRVERRFYRWLCDYFLETFKLLSMSDAKLLRHLEFRGGEQVEQVFADGRTVAVIMGHYCNWEWLSAIGLAFPHYPDAVKGLIYHPLRSDPPDWLFIDIRSAHGGLCINKRHVLRHLVQFKREKKQIWSAHAEANTSAPSDCCQPTPHRRKRTPSRAVSSRCWKRTYTASQPTIFGRTTAGSARTLSTTPSWKSGANRGATSKKKTK